VTKENRVVVIGAGIIGAACAWRLAEAGAQVTVYDRNAPGSGASQAALGVLGFHSRPEMPDALDELCRLSSSYFPAVVDELAGITGQQVDFRAGGQLSVAFDKADLAELDELYEYNRTMGIAVERPTPEECLLLAPGINPELQGALFFPGDAWIDNTALTLVMVEAAKKAGASFMRGEVSAVIREENRVTGVLIDGEPKTTDWVVLAAGCWSGQVRGTPSIAVEPVRGQALMVEGQPIRRVVMSPRGYLVPKGETQTMVGATVERVGFDDTNTLGGIEEVARVGLELAPGLARTTFIGAWAGLRPAPMDEHPLIGPFGELPNLIVAAGHFRHGILLAPITADMVRSIIVGTESPAAVEPFLPDRRH
jgi:glycine oxidase